MKKKILFLFLVLLSVNVNSPQGRYCQIVENPQNLDISCEDNGVIVRGIRIDKVEVIQSPTPDWEGGMEHLREEIEKIENGSAIEHNLIDKNGKEYEKFEHLAVGGNYIFLINDTYRVSTVEQILAIDCINYGPPPIPNLLGWLIIIIMGGFSLSDIINKKRVKKLLLL